MIGRGKLEAAVWLALVSHVPDSTIIAGGDFHRVCSTAPRPRCVKTVVEMVIHQNGSQKCCPEIRNCSRLIKWKVFILLWHKPRFAWFNMSCTYMSPERWDLAVLKISAKFFFNNTSRLEETSKQGWILRGWVLPFILYRCVNKYTCLSWKFWVVGTLSRRPRPVTQARAVGSLTRIRST